MLIKEVLTLAVKLLDNFPFKHLEARILLAYTLDITPDSLFIKYDEQISKEDENKFFKYIERRKLYEPIAYIIGKKEFYSIDFLVNKHVLIPRGDTETLVNEVIDEYNNNYFDSEVKILDLGTGSGAIAISLAVNIPKAKIVATDISDEALKIAKNNAKSNNILNNIEFIKSDWYLNLINRKNHNKKILEKDRERIGEFDFIVSNPPYISLDEELLMSKETLLYEPKTSLFAENSGLINYEKIIADTVYFLKNSGKLFLEIGFNQSKAVVSILTKHKFAEIKVVQDICGHDRIIIASFK